MEANLRNNLLMFLNRLRDQASPAPSQPPSTPELENHIETQREKLQQTQEYTKWTSKQRSIYSSLRESRQGRFVPRSVVVNGAVPNHGAGAWARMPQNVFVGKFSRDGSMYISACQDTTIRIFSTPQLESQLRVKHSERAMRRFSDGCSAIVEPIKSVSALHVGWSILDVDFSPDQKYFMYSTWGPCAYMCPVSTEDPTDDSQHALNFEPRSRFCAFSVKFSPDSREVLAGGNDGCLYVYDLHSDKRILRFQAHTNDVNSVAFSDNPNVLLSGSDDGLCKLWDRRTFTEERPRPAGLFVGHTGGIVFVEGHADGRYVLTNSKDQSMKLFDVRKAVDAQYEAEMTGLTLGKMSNWDYRNFGDGVPTQDKHPHDVSVMTFKGHKVVRTLIRCHFSPAETTGQRYVYSGSGDGSVYIYEVATGELICKLGQHSTIVRDVAWHPHLPLIVTSSFDGTHSAFDYRDSQRNPSMPKDSEQIPPTPKNRVPTGFHCATHVRPTAYEAQRIKTMRLQKQITKSNRKPKIPRSRLRQVLTRRAQGSDSESDGDELEKGIIEKRGPHGDGSEDEDDWLPSRHAWQWRPGVESDSDD